MAMGVCMAGGTCVAGGGEHVWQGGMHGKSWACVARGVAWQERRPLQQTVRILLECILVTTIYTC